MPRAGPVSQETTSGVETVLGSLEVVTGTPVQPPEKGEAIQVDRTNHYLEGSYTDGNMSNAESAEEYTSLIHQVTSSEHVTSDCSDISDERAQSNPRHYFLISGDGGDDRTSSHSSATFCIRTEQRECCSRSSTANLNDGPHQRSQCLLSAPEVKNRNSALNEIGLPSSRERMRSPENISPDYESSRSRTNYLNMSASECCCVWSERETSGSLSSRPHAVAFTASHLRQKAGTPILKNVLSADTCAVQKVTAHRSPSGRKGRLSPRSLCSADKRETRSTDFSHETAHKTNDLGVLLKASRVLSLINDTEEPKGEDVKLGGTDRAILGEIDKYHDKNKGNYVVDPDCQIATQELLPVHAEKVRVTAREAMRDLAYTDCLVPSYPEKNLSEMTELFQKSISSSKDGMDTKKKSTDMTEVPGVPRQYMGTASKNSGAKIAEYSIYTTLERSESLALELERDSRCISNQFADKPAETRCDETASKHPTSISKGSAELSPQQKFSFVWSDFLTGCANTSSYIILNETFLRSLTPTQWVELLPAAKNADGALETNVPAKGLSVPERPTYHDIDATDAAVHCSPTKRTVSCPLSLDSDSICYETGDREVFAARQSSPSCWWCNTNERRLDNSGSIHVEVEEYEKLRERVGQRRHTSALLDDPKTDRSSLEWNIDMATLDCSIAGVEDYCRVELFSKQSSSSSKSHAKNSFEELLQKEIRVCDDMNAPEELPGSKAYYADDNQHNLRQLGPNRTFSDHNEDQERDLHVPMQQEGNTGGPEGEISAPPILGATSGRTVSGTLFSSSIQNQDMVTDDKTRTLSLKEDEIASQLSGHGLDESSAVSSNSSLNAMMIGEGYVNAPLRGSRLADLLDTYATGLSIKDIMHIPSKLPNRAVSPLAARLDDADFTLYIPNEALSLQEALTSMPKVICKSKDGNI